MPRVKQVVARKDYPQFGISKGQKHYFWQLKTGPRSSRTFRQIAQPRPSQLTTSEFLGTIGDIELEFAELTHDENLPDALREIAERVRAAGEEARERFDNMPEGLQQGDTGQLLEERADSAESWADEIEQAADTLTEALEEIANTPWQELDAFAHLDPEDEDYEEPDEEEIEEARNEQRSEAYEEAISASESPGFS